MKEYTVYWYHLKEHNNPHCEGYIGITNDIKRRHNEHMRNSNNMQTHFYKAIEKYGKDGIIKDILHSCSKEDALALEYYYRPNTNIGWNVATGGEDTLASAVSVEITLYHKDNPNKLYTFPSMTNAAKELGLSEGRIRQAYHRKKQLYGFDGWAIMVDSKFDRTGTITVQEDISNRLTGVKRNKPSHYKGITDRWTEEQKALIGSYHKGKIITEEHKKSMSDKLKATSPCCKVVVLYHKDQVEKLYTYHSIAEASRQLDIPLSRLKSKAQRPLNRFGKDGWAIKSLGSE